MKTSHFAAALAFAILVVSGASAQDRHDQQQFNDHDRQVTQDYYNQHHSRPPAGLRSQDRLPADQEQRLEPGQPYDRDLERRSHSVPRDLSRRLPPAPRHHKYVAVGGRVALVDTVNHVLRDVIRITEPPRH
jgi:Ni/Co efflux regulator RcnB